MTVIDPPDSLSVLLRQFQLSARVFHSGAFCGVTDFDDVHDVSYVHVVRRGPLDMLHRDGTRLRIDDPAVVFYPRPLWHRMQTSEACAAELVCASIRLSGGALNPLAHALPAPVVVPLAQTATLDATLKLLFAEAFEQHNGKQAMLDRLCEAVLIHVLRFALGAERQALGVLAALAQPQLARALLAMHEDPARHWQVAQLANIAGMSRTRFASAFHASVGLAPGAYLTTLRLRIAQELLARGKALKFVANEVGYDSANALSRAFAARVGQSPRHWLRARARTQEGRGVR